MKIIKIIDTFKSFFSNKKTINRVELMTENGNNFVSWNGKIYNFDIVRACIRPKVKAIGKLVAKHIKETLNDDGTIKLEINPHFSIKMLLEEPNPLMTGQMLQEKLATQLCLNNNAFALIVRDENALPREIYPICPRFVEAQYINGDLYLHFTLENNKSFEIPYTDIIHLRNDFNDNDIFGTPLAPVLVPLLEVVSITDQGIINAIKNSSVIRWILQFTQTVRKEDLNKKAEDFAKNFLNVNNSSGVVVTDASFDAKPIEQKDLFVPNAAQMTQTNQRIFNLFNTNQAIITSNWTEENYEAYYSSEIEPYLIQFKNEYTRKIFSRKEIFEGNKIVFEANSWDGASLSTKLNLLNMVDRGALTPNEWRHAFNLAPVEGGDKPIRRLDTKPVDVDNVKTE